MWSTMRFVYHAARWARLRSELDAATPAFGSRSAPQATCTWLMGIGFLLGFFGLVLFGKALLLLGITLFGIGLVMALVEAVFDLLR